MWQVVHCTRASALCSLPKDLPAACEDFAEISLFADDVKLF